MKVRPKHKTSVSLIKISSITFEAVLHYLDVHVFDFCMIVDVCLHHDARVWYLVFDVQIFSWNLVKRLKELEEKILQCEVWKTEQPIYSEMVEDSTAAANEGYQPSPSLL